MWTGGTVVIPLACDSSRLTQHRPMPARVFETRRLCLTQFELVYSETAFLTYSHPTLMG